MMETPNRAQHKRNSFDTPTTEISSVFDDDSPLSSSVSPVSSNGDDKLYQDKAPTEQQPTKDNSAQDIATKVNPNYYGTAASQRGQRRTTRQPRYSNFFSESRSQSVNDDQAQERPAIESEQTPAATEESRTTSALVNEEQQATESHPRGLKRKQQSSNLDFILHPPQKKVKKDIETLTESGSPRQLRKRKVDTSASEVPQLPTKKAKTFSNARSTSSPKSKLSSKSSPIKPTVDLHPRRRVTRGITRSQELVTHPHEPASPASGKDSLIVVLRRMPPEWLVLLRGDITPASTSQNTSPSTQQNVSFASTSNQFVSDGQDQCAQPALAPIPASSQLSSVDVSQLAQPREASPDAEETHQNLEEHGLDVAFVLKFATSQERPCEEVAQPDRSSQQLPVAAASEEQYMPLALRAPSFESTQPTQPWNPPVSTTSPLLEVDSDLIVPELVPATNPDLVQVDYGIDSDATTEFEEEIEACIPETISQEQQVLWNITEQLFAIRKSNLTKPAPAGQPEVWAEGRQELCETLHYFRSYQSACYATGGYVRGFMFDKVAHARDYIDSDVVISRAGGGLSKDKESGEMRSSQDQTDDTPIVQALKNCMKHYNPVVVITGVDNPHVPSQPPHQYCVLDYFKPTHIWFEKSGNSKILRYRFEKLNTQKESWWRPENEQEIVELGALGPPVESICECCGETSQQIYFNGWMCLQPNCSAFWHIANGSSLGSHKLSYEPDEGSLVYDPRFLKQKTPWLNDNSDYPLSFNTTELSGYSVMGEDVSQAFWAGIVCPDCGKCNSRLGWTGWDCSNPTCRFSKEPPHSLIPAKSLRDPFWPLTADYPLSRDTHAPLINVDVSFAHGYRINRYNIPGLDGFITHMIANKTVVEEPGGPDTMFEELQQTDIDLRRRAMPNGQLKGESYCRHFSVNYGMPYKFIASTASHSFFDAACPITATRSRLNWAAKHLLSQAPSSDTSMQEEEEEKTSDWDENKEFNEVLALGYFESQKINYHDDGEFGLGPTIATLSLGAAGTMRIRMKSRHYHGCSAAGVYDDSTPLPGSQQYESRLALHADLQALKKRDVRAYRARLKQIPRELKLKSSGNAKDVLRMEVGHGDVVVMHGREVQKYYEHAVEHGGKLRFALTCRYIDPESLSEADRPGYTVGRDEGGYDGAKVC